MDELKNGLEEIVRGSKHPDILMGFIAGFVAWAITTMLRVLFG